MKDILPLNPVLDLDVGYVFKMSDIVCDNSQPLAEGMTGNDHIKLVNTFAFPFKGIFDIAVSMLVSSKYCLFFIVLVIYLAKAESMAVAEHFLHIVSGHIVAAR